MNTLCWTTTRNRGRWLSCMSVMYVSLSALCIHYFFLHLFSYQFPVHICVNHHCNVPGFKPTVLPLSEWIVGNYIFLQSCVLAKTSMLFYFLQQQTHHSTQGFPALRATVPMITLHSSDCTQQHSPQQQALMPRFCVTQMPRIIFILFFFRNPIIPYQGVGQDQDLGPVRRICQGLGVAHHTNLEYCRKRSRLNKAWEHHNIRKTWTSIMWKYFIMWYICVSVKPHPIISEVAEFLGTRTTAAFPGIKASELLYDV